VIERVFIDNGVTGGTSGVVRTGSAAVRAVQTGFLRNYVGLIVIGMVAVTVYFLLQT
jgi:NADH-quinone oxidoreductase subunit L